MKRFSSLNISNILLPCILGYAWYMLVVVHGNLLYAIQDFSPWLGTNDYFWESLSHPGGLREWAGDWLTQLFYYPWLGGSIMAMMWMLIGVAMIRACRLTGSSRLFAALPVLALLAGLVQLGYWIFCLKTASYWFGPTIGALCIALYAWASSLGGRTVRYLLLAIWTVIGIPALGWMGTVGILVLLGLVPKPQNARQWGLLVAPALVALMTVLGYYSHLTTLQWNEPLLWYGFPHIIIPEASSPLLDAAPYALAASLVLLPVVGRLQDAAPLKRFSLPIALVMMALGICGVHSLDYNPSTFRRELAMLRGMDEGRWSDVLTQMMNIKEPPTREMVIMKDVALTHLGKLPDEAFQFDIRGTKPEMNDNFPIHMVHSAGPLFYYWYGLPNYAYLWAMENAVEYGLSPYWLRLFYRCAVVNGETALAHKYKALLQTTLFHKNIEVSDKEMQSIRELTPDENELTNDNNYCEMFLDGALCRASYQTKRGKELGLHYTLIMRQPELFAYRLDEYANLVGRDKPLPLIYQEALLLFVANQTGDDAEVMASLPISDYVRNRFAQYRSAVLMSAQQGLPVEKVASQLYSRFGNTYWWYYDLYTNNKTY